MICKLGVNYNQFAPLIIKIQSLMAISSNTNHSIHCSMFIQLNQSYIDIHNMVEKLYEITVLVVPL